MPGHPKEALVSSVICVASVLTLSCRGCSSGTTSNAAPEKAPQTELVQLRERLSGRRLDRSKVYPKGDDGKIQCNSDGDCFVIAGESCAPAVLMHTDSASGYGLTQSVTARYTITGKNADKCQLTREVVKLEASIDQRWAEMLKSKGKDDDFVEQIRSDALERLREGNPLRLECELSSEKMLEGSLNLAENRYDPLFWRMACNEIVTSIGSNR